jgi:hypothetical protein
MLREGESLILPIYRALLKRLGYSANELLAELEVTLEAEGRLDAFAAAMLEATNGNDWVQVRDVALAKNYANRALHIIDAANFPNADSWEGCQRAPHRPQLARQPCHGAAQAPRERRDAIVFVVDEVGQYVARSSPRMFDLQGLAEAFLKKRGPLWLVVTSQEKLSDVVDSLESRQVEYAESKTDSRYGSTCSPATSTKSPAGAYSTRPTPARQQSVTGSLPIAASSTPTPVSNHEPAQPILARMSSCACIPGAVPGPAAHRRCLRQTRPGRRIPHARRVQPHDHQARPVVSDRSHQRPRRGAGRGARHARPRVDLEEAGVAVATGRLGGCAG